MQNMHNPFIELIREIGYAVIGILKIPLTVLGYVLGVPIGLLAMASDFGRGGRSRSQNYFIRLVEKLWHINL